MAANTTRGIQIVLGLWIAGTIIALVWAAIDAGRSAPSRPAPVARESSGTGGVGR